MTNIQGDSIIEDARNALRSMERLRLKRQKAFEEALDRHMNNHQSPEEREALRQAFEGYDKALGVTHALQVIANSGPGEGQNVSRSSLASLTELLEHQGENSDLAAIKPLKAFIDKYKWQLIGAAHSKLYPERNGNPGRSSGSGRYHSNTELERD